MDQQRQGSCSSIAGPSDSTMRLFISSNTGSPVELIVPRGETVGGLKSGICRRLGLQRDRIVLLHRDRQLSAGSLLDLGVTEGSKLTLVPVIEAGLVCATARAEKTMMDVLDSLSEDQISDFLSGQSPLTLKLGVGAHTMYVQLQLTAQEVAELQHNRESKPWIRSNGKLPTEVSTNHSGSTSVQYSKGSPLGGRSASSPAVNCHCLSAHQPSCPHTAVRCGSPPPRCLKPASTRPGPPSPRPASTFAERGLHLPPGDPCKKPGAIIESFVSHSPGVFSGTFSGTLSPCGQASVRHPRPGITIILQILTDLLSAASNHQDSLETRSHRSDSAEGHSRTPTEPMLAQQVVLSKAPAVGAHQVSTEENRTLHCKLEQLQFLMDQRRERRKTRRRAQIPPTSHPYHRCHQIP
ncbi:midnolin-A-like isoform X1 [Synchiropus splendidus]|uniref:midnolin-A-like isoform X1 n=1 Tax=Synchiropus splendidus TaxID=270530 RepID=UPI00237EDEA0|nr:midnolin-A-like isoform X1 [Synchiropus splendidus]